MKYLILTGVALCLVGCASASKPGAMLASVSEQTIISEMSPLREAVRVGDVDGGKKTNPLWSSQVSSEDFSEALRQSLSAHAMLSGGDGDYRLDATLQNLKQPFIGISMTVTSTVQYKLTNLKTGAVVFEEIIETPYTAKMGDAFVGVKRLQLANEGSIKSNISSVIKMMIKQVDNVGGSNIALVVTTTKSHT
ncbi:MAG: hypothetical protein JKX72_11250 [Robiginitomaculum sp.]|nr:hypothetical protein [Robiginitomaculum sp.]